MTTRNKFKPKERLAFRRRLKELVQAGNKSHEIAQVMTAEGYTRPDGSAVTDIFVKNQSYAMGGMRRIAKKRRVDRAPRLRSTPPVDQSDDKMRLVQEVLTSNMPDDIKVRLLASCVR